MRPPKRSISRTDEFGGSSVSKRIRSPAKRGNAAFGGIRLFATAAPQILLPRKSHGNAQPT